MTRTEMAVLIMQGMCAGDWQMPIPKGMKWDDVAIPRAYEIVDKIISMGVNHDD